jgi:peptide-methionine (S)-S-oxide reductase
MTEIATLGGGCFWCLEAVYQQVRGVHSVVSGYAGGQDTNPNYEAVCSETTGHAEVVQIQFDSAIVSYREILTIFFVIHDPTTLNRQGGDIGSQYRSAIFTTSESQQLQAEVTRDVYQAALDREGLDSIVTEIISANGVTYYLAEDYHQKYLKKNPHGYDCHSSTGVAFPVIVN